MRPATLASVLTFALVVAGATRTRGAPMALQTLKLTSPAFANAGDIPSVFTCEGKDVSPPLGWSDVPANAKSVALLVEDPDAPDPKAPKRTFVHWVLYNVPTTARGVPEDARANGLPEGAIEGRTDWGQPGYRGPCPPIGKHRYFFRLYALDVAMDLQSLKAATKPDLERAMEGHVVGKGELLGFYEKKRDTK
jgi:Raf kinase inhibitor-like YbhB/YbcL family protein